MKLPIFILGTQRSGTTLLTKILTAHPKIIIQNEIDLTKIFGKNYSKEQIVKEIADRVKTDSGKHIDDILDDVTVWGLKDPQLTEHIEELKLFVDDTKFIIIIRDGRGVVNSYMENKWGLGTNAYTGAKRWVEEVEAQEVFSTLHPDNFLIIRYEDIVSNLEKEIRKICKHLTIPFDMQMLAYNKEDANYVRRPENEHTFKKPDTKLAKKWQKKLTTHQVNIIEGIAGNTLSRYNYQLSGKPVKPGSIEKLYYIIHQAVIGEIQIQYRWRKHRLKQFIKRFASSPRL